MNRIPLLLPLAALLIVAPARAQTPATHYADRPLEINAHAGVLIFDDVIADGDTEALFGARVAYNMAGGLGFGANFDVVPAEFGNLYLYSGEVDYTFGSSTRAHFFVGAGLGQASFDPDDEDVDGDSELLIPLVVGVKWFSRTHDPNWAIRGELRDNIIKFDDPADETTNNIELSVGLSLLFGR